MMWASAMSQVKGKDYDYIMCCIGAQCCPFCTFAYTFYDLSQHYGIKENMIPLKCCLPLLSLYQILDTVLVKEGLHMTIAGVAPDVQGGTPQAEDMQR